MNTYSIMQVLGLLVIANGSPILVKRLFGNRYSLPIDRGIRLRDGKPVFGASKTVRGIAVSLIATTLLAPLLGLHWSVGLLAASMAMAGDLISSFTKRRLGVPSSGMAVGLDQIPESLLPALALMTTLNLTPIDVGVIVVLFFFGELVLSRVMYRLGIRDRPY